MKAPSMLENFNKISDSQMGASRILKVFQYGFYVLSGVLSSKEAVKTCEKYFYLILESRLTFGWLAIITCFPPLFTILKNKEDKLRKYRFIFILTIFLCSVFTFASMSIDHGMFEPSKEVAFYVGFTANCLWFLIGLSGVVLDLQQIKELKTQVKEKDEEKKVADNKSKIQDIKMSVISNCCEMILAFNCMKFDKLFFKFSIPRFLVGVIGIISAAVQL